MDNLRTNAAPAGQFATKTHPHTPFTVLPSKLIQVTTTPTLLRVRELAGEPDLVHAFSTLELSSGQRKRLALVAAYLEDRPIYLFDEWAADQDPLFKEIFYTQILPALKARGKTCVVITHDDRYFGCADRVLKLESGQLLDRSAAPKPASAGS